MTCIGVLLQAFAKGVIPFFEHLLDPDFLHAVRDNAWACVAPPLPASA